MAYFTKYGAVFLAAIGILALATSIIAQVIKELPPLDRIKTSWVVTVIALVLTNIAFMVMLMLCDLTYAWYYTVAGVVSGFIVSYISMFGWEQFSSLWRSLQKPDKI